MLKEEMMAAVEAILFVSTDAVSLHDISDILGIERSVAGELLDSLILDFEVKGRGLRILKANDTFRMATSPSCKDHIRRFTGRNFEKGLSGACTETLTIIAYHQPITRLAIEDLRGVNCERTIAVLLGKGLVKHVGRTENAGRPILYGTTDQFLRSFGLTSLKELPALGENE